MRRKAEKKTLVPTGLDLPGEAFGELLITVVGNDSVRIENHRGIAQFSGEYLRLSTRGGGLSIFGREMKIRVLAKQVLVVEGRIQALEWET